MNKIFNKEQPKIADNSLSASSNNLVEQPLIDHLLELRSRLIKALVGVFVIFFMLVGFANPIYSYLAKPLLSAMPIGGKLISIDMTASFFVPIKLVFSLSFYIVLPWILYQVWAFVGPGLYKNEKRVITPIIFSSTLLFYVGMVFAFYLVLPIMSKFLVGTTPEGVEMATDIGKYLSMVLTLFFIFGFVFEIPVVVIILVTAGVMSVESIAAKRRYIILIAFVIAAVVTPPDPLSQILFASAGILLFEVGLFIAKRLKRNS